MPPPEWGKQSPVIVRCRAPRYRQAVMELNKQARGGTGDPYYGAPTIVLVLADPERGTCVEDASCVLCTMMDAAHAIGLASCWIHGEKEMFQLPEGKALLKEWGLPENLRGVGSLALGYAAGPLPQPKERQSRLHPQGVRAQRGNSRGNCTESGSSKRDRFFRFSSREWFFLCFSP